MPTTPAPLLWINGFPGSGKLTVATALTTLDEAIVLIDNHALIDPVEARLPRNHPDYQAERHVERKRAFDENVLNTAMISRVIVFTGQALVLSFLLCMSPC